MPNNLPHSPDLTAQRERALSRWDNDGGAGPDGPQEGAKRDAIRHKGPELTHADLVQLRVRGLAPET